MPIIFTCLMASDGAAESFGYSLINSRKEAFIQTHQATEDKLMGTWSQPNTTTKACELQRLMTAPITRKTACDQLYDLVGDDDLFDFFKMSWTRPMMFAFWSNPTLRKRSSICICRCNPRIAKPSKFAKQSATVNGLNANHRLGFQRHFIKRSTIRRAGGLLSRIVLPTPHDHIHVLRIQLNEPG
jgi:hypothetical protein